MTHENLFHPFTQTQAALQKQRCLPHWNHPNATYFVTFRTADSLPQCLLAQLRLEKESFLERHPKPWSPQTRQLHRQTFSRRIENLLDQGYGSCPFRDPRKAKILADSLHHFDTTRYILDDFAVMPNHAHVLIKPLDYKLDQILHSWKSFSALKINRLSGQTGPFWFDESFDHIVRSWQRLEAFRTYIRENPKKAGLKQGDYLLGQGSGVKQASCL